MKNGKGSAKSSGTPSPDNTTVRNLWLANLIKKVVASFFIAFFTKTITLLTFLLLWRLMEEVWKIWLGHLNGVEQKHLYFVYCGRFIATTTAALLTLFNPRVAKRWCLIILLKLVFIIIMFLFVKTHLRLHLCVLDAIWELVTIIL